MNPLLTQFVLGLAGVPEKDIQDLERTMPSFAALCRTAQKLAPLIEEADPLVADLGPKLEVLMPSVLKVFDLFKQMSAIAKPEVADFNKAMPVVQEFVDFLNTKS